MIRRIQFLLFIVTLALPGLAGEAWGHGVRHRPPSPVEASAESGASWTFPLERRPRWTIPVGSCPQGRWGSRRASPTRTEGPGTIRAAGLRGNASGSPGLSGASPRWPSPWARSRSAWRSAGHAGPSPSPWSCFSGSSPSRPRFTRCTICRTLPRPMPAPSPPRPPILPPPIPASAPRLCCSPRSRRWASRRSRPGPGPRAPGVARPRSARSARLTVCRYQKSDSARDR